MILATCRKFGARLVVYNTEPGYPGIPNQIAEYVRHIGAAEILVFRNTICGCLRPARPRRQCRKEGNFTTLSEVAQVLPILHDRNISSAIVRNVPPHYTRSLDYDVDVNDGSLDDEFSHNSFRRPPLIRKHIQTCVLQVSARWPKPITEAVREFFKGALHDVSVIPADANRSGMKSILQDGSIGLNLHSTGPVGQGGVVPHGTVSF